MNSWQSITTCVEHLTPGITATERQSRLAKVQSLLGSDATTLEWVAKVLRAEFEQPFYDPAHYRATVQEKSAFHFERARTTCRVLREIFGMCDFCQGNFLPQVLGDYSAETVAAATQTLDESGYTIFPQRLSPATCDKIVAALEQVPFRVKADGAIIHPATPQTVQQANGNTIWVLNHQDVLAIPEVQSLVADPMLLSVIQNYLECIPIHVQTNCWWTINRGITEASQSQDAQLFHQDKEFIRFVKVFVYLNDVDERNGPHTYIKGSARDYLQHVPPDYQISQRLSDEYLEHQYAADRFVSVTGSRGTIVLEDTSGFHKGTPVLDGYRLMLQLEYCCSLYFNPVGSFGWNGLTGSYRALAAKWPRVLMNYDDARYDQHRHKLHQQVEQDRQRRLASQPVLQPRGLFKRIRKMFAGSTGS